MKLRLIAGEKGGLGLVSPKGDATRPTLARVRSSLFMILQDALPGARVLDLFAGVGTLGLEALSRGAARATLIENARPALDALRANLVRTGWGDRAQIVTRDAFGWLKTAAPADGDRFTLVLLDPPYHRDLGARTMVALAERADALIAPGALVAAQVGRRDALEPTYGPLAEVDRRDYAETRIAFYRLQS